MFKVESITKENIEEIKALYNHFCNVAVKDFLFEMPPLNFVDFKNNFDENFIKGYFCKDTEPEGFMLYTDCINQAIEISMIHTRNNEKAVEIKKSLLTEFLHDIEKEHPNKIISYPMLGVQNGFVEDITHFDFNLLGEMIVEFNFYNTISQVVLTKADIPCLTEPYNFDRWQPIYFDDATRIIFEEFSKSNDVLFDPRFLTLDGTKEILSCITENQYGTFLPKYTTVLKYKEQPVGFCFVNLTTPNIANIPLLAISKKHQRLGLASILLKNSLTLLNEAIEEQDLPIKTINATCDTENFPAIKSYRKVGFKEKNYYTHAYKKA